MSNGIKRKGAKAKSLEAKMTKSAERLFKSLGRCEKVSVRFDVEIGCDGTHETSFLISSGETCSGIFEMGKSLKAVTLIALGKCADRQTAVEKKIEEFTRQAADLGLVVSKKEAR